LLAGVSSAAKAGDAPDADSVSRLLPDGRTQAYTISVDATIPESCTPMKDDVNTAAKTVGQLVDAMPHAADWQATAIDQILPFMRETGDDITAAIEYLNGDRARPLIVGDYRELTPIPQEPASLIATQTRMKARKTCHR